MIGGEITQGQGARVELLAAIAGDLFKPKKQQAGFSMQAPQAESVSASLCAADCLSDYQEQELSDLIDWARKLDKVIRKKIETVNGAALPLDVRQLEAVRFNLGYIISEGEQKYQRSWFARSQGLAGRVA